MAALGVVGTKQLPAVPKSFGIVVDRGVAGARVDVDEDGAHLGVRSAHIGGLPRDEREALSCRCLPQATAQRYAVRVGIGLSNDRIAEVVSTTGTDALQVA